MLATDRRPYVAPVGMPAIMPGTSVPYNPAEEEMVRGCKRTDLWRRPFVAVSPAPQQRALVCDHGLDPVDQSSADIVSHAPIWTCVCW